MQELTTVRKYLDVHVVHITEFDQQANDVIHK